MYFSCVNGEKYLIFTQTDRNERVPKNYKKLWDEVKEEIRTIKGMVNHSNMKKIT